MLPRTYPPQTHTACFESPSTMHISTHINPQSIDFILTPPMPSKLTSIHIFSILLIPAAAYILAIQM
eukprot:c22400_g6_i2 orf=445-645(+)